MHDEIGQLLTGVKLSLESVTRVPPDKVAGTLGQARGQVQNLIAQVRNLSLDLRPSLLDDFGLHATLQWLFERYTTQTGIDVEADLLGLERRFPPEVETAAFRIVQEGLTNVARHAGTTVAWVHLWHDAGRLYVQVVDEGKGFDAAARVARGSTGLSGMRELRRPPRRIPRRQIETRQRHHPHCRDPDPGPRTWPPASSAVPAVCHQES